MKHIKNQKFTLTQNGISKNYHKQNFIIKIKCFFQKYEKIGFGLFIWKPYIIYQKMLETTNGEFICYQDSSQYDFEDFKNDLMPVCNFIKKNNIFFIPGFIINKPNKILISNECQKYMNVNNDLDFLNKLHIQTSPMIMMKNEKTMNMISEWLKYCQIPKCILKTSNTHQCDQVILNILLHKYNFKGILFMENKNESKKYTMFWNMLIGYINNGDLTL